MFMWLFGPLACCPLNQLSLSCIIRQGPEVLNCIDSDSGSVYPCDPGTVTVKIGALCFVLGSNGPVTKTDSVVLHRELYCGFAIRAKVIHCLGGCHQWGGPKLGLNM